MTTTTETTKIRTRFNRTLSKGAGLLAQLADGDREAFAAYTRTRDLAYKAAEQMRAYDPTESETMIDRIVAQGRDLQTALASCDRVRIGRSEARATILREDYRTSQPAPGSYEHELAMMAGRRRSR